ncbi:MAG: resolvase, terminal domain protein [Anaerocolumna sp.]|jgi:DNA invertase Pin-like site-specific DNA recombinase|nr:resolvase, terminal domain protein [Anaerocolumna sp.]
MKKAYCRVSTIEQNLDRQIIAVKEAGAEKIYTEKLSGKNTDRPELQNMLAELQAGDIVIVKELTRVSRSTLDMLQLVEKITTKGADIKSLNEGWLDTSTPAGKLMLTVLGGIAEFERNLLLQRTAEGRAVAVSKGVQMGRKRVKNKQLDFAVQLFESGTMSANKICENTGVSRATLFRRVKERKELLDLAEV